MKIASMTKIVALTAASVCFFSPAAHAGWFEDATGVSTPQFIQRNDPTRYRDDGGSTRSWAIESNSRKTVTGPPLGNVAKNTGPYNGPVSAQNRQGFIDLANGQTFKPHFRDSFTTKDGHTYVGNGSKSGSVIPSSRTGFASGGSKTNFNAPITGNALGGGSQARLFSSTAAGRSPSNSASRGKR